MKVDQASLAYIQKVVTTARLFGIDGIIIEPGRVRAVDEDSTVIILQTTNVPELPFGSIGLNRTDIFCSRYDMTSKVDNFEMDAVVEGPDGATYARSLAMKAKGIKVDYRCANPATIRAPKGLNDSVKYKASMYSGIVQFLNKSASAMESDEVTLIGDQHGVTMEVSDINGDKLSYKCSETPQYIAEDGGSEIKFSHRYPTKLLQIMFKNNLEGPYKITGRGMLRVVINDLEVSVLPRT